MADYEREKELAARHSLDFVKDGMLLGLGTGSTAAYAVQMIGQRVREGLSVKGVPTSAQTRELAIKEGIPLAEFDGQARIDLTIDGADEVDPRLRLVKGGGGALLREKIVAAASDKVVIIGDSRKPVEVLGAFPLPVEVIPFGWKAVAQRIEALGGRHRLRVNAGGSPVQTDEGNYLLDCSFGEIPEPETLADRLDGIPGLVEHGLFVGLASLVIIGRGEQTVVLEPPPSR